MRSRVDPDARLARAGAARGLAGARGPSAEPVAELIDVALAGDTPPRERVSAIKALLMAGRVEPRGDPDGDGGGVRGRWRVGWRLLGAVTVANWAR